MSAAVITEIFEQWKARQAASGQAVVLDEFVFANVPNLDVSAPIDRAAGLPDAAHIVYRQAVGKTGLVNENAVVYSVTLGADVGDFSFNWIGLVNKAAGTLAMVVHAPVQSKVKNANGQQGNVLTRSFLMEYNGAETQTLISTPAETWQIDFTARLAGMDEALRLANVDVYGAGAFFDTGFLVAKTGNQYFVTAGVGYIGGLRAALAENANITVTAKPMKVWVDVSYHGTLTSAYQTDIKFTLATELANYTQSGIAHYVFALASIDANGVITDLRPKGSSQYLRKDENLAEIADPAAALNTLNGVPKTRTVNKKPLTTDIDLSPDDVGALSAGGTAVATTKLATPRKIAGVVFDGTKDIGLNADNVGAFPAKGGTVGSDGVSTPYLAVTGSDWMTKNGNYASGNNYQTNWTRINGRSGTDAKVDIYHYESTGNYHSLDFHVFGGGNEGYFNHRNDGTFFCTGPVIGAAATANGHAVNLAQLNAAAAKRALLAGSTVQTFDVAQATSWGHAVRLDQFQFGNNGNGAWIKLPGGAQWCRQNLSLAPNTTTSWTFPASFPGTPAVFFSAFNAAPNAWFNGVSSNGANIYNASNAYINVNILAIW